MLYVINFADRGFAQQQHDNTMSAYKKGKADKVIEYHPDDIDKSFIEANPGVFKFMDRGYGLWIWKAYFITKTLERLSYGDYLFYCDSGSYFINDIHILIKIMEEKAIDLMPFELPLLEFQWTKREAYDKMGISDFSRNQVLAGYILLKKSQFTISFFKEWLTCMTDLQLSSPEMQTSTTNFENFITHREDQAVFSLLVHKHQLEVFRDPSQFGEWPWLYNTEDKIIFHPKNYSNSPYPRILVSNRRILARKFRRTMFFKDTIDSVGLYKPIYDIKKRITIWLKESF
jgi:hypothetical protein